MARSRSCLLAFTVFAAFFLVLHSTAYAGNRVTDTTATVVAYWSEGDVRDVVVRHDKTKTSGNGQTTRESVRYNATFRILEETEESYTIEWTYGEFEIEEVSNPLLATLAGISEGMKIIYRTDELGTFKELVNWEDVRRYVELGIDEAEKALREKLGDNPEAGAYVDQFMAQFRELFSTREGIENTLTEIQLCHEPFGLEYTLNERLSGDTLLPNVFGGDPIPATIEVEMTELVPDENHARIVISQRVDEEKARDMVYEFVKKLAEQSGQPLPDDAELPVLFISDHKEYDIELSDGWVRKVYFERNIKSGPASKVETYEITMK